MKSITIHTLTKPSTVNCIITCNKSGYYKLATQRNKRQNNSCVDIFSLLHNYEYKQIVKF